MAEVEGEQQDGKEPLEVRELLCALAVQRIKPEPHQLIGYHMTWLSPTFPDPPASCMPSPDALQAHSLMSTGVNDKAKAKCSQDAEQARKC